MGIAAFPVVSPGTVTDTWDPTSSVTGARGEPGTTVVVRNSSGEFSLAQIVQLDNNGCAAGEALVQNYATLKGYSVKTAATSDEGAPMKGIAAAAIASQKCGYMYIGGYVETAQVSQTVASGEYLMIGGSVAGELTNNKASVFNAGTQGNTSAFMVVAVARAAFGTGTGSVQIVGVWG